MIRMRGFSVKMASGACCDFEDTAGEDTQKIIYSTTDLVV